MSLSHLFVLVSDLQRSKRFYTEVLGLRVTMELDGYVRLEGDSGFHIGMEQGGPGQVGGKGIEIEIQVEDVDRAYQEMAAKGARFRGPPSDQEWGARHAWF